MDGAGGNPGAGSGGGFDPCDCIVKKQLVKLLF